MKRCKGGKKTDKGLLVFRLELTNKIFELNYESKTQMQLGTQDKNGTVS